MKTYKTFDEYFHEQENFATRAERAFETLGPDAETWLMACWIEARKAGYAAGLVSCRDTSDRDYQL